MQHGKYLKNHNPRIYLPSFPETCTFLNPADRVLAVARGRDGYDKEESSLVNTKAQFQVKPPIFRFNYVQFVESLLDVRIWLLAVAYLFIAAASDLMIVATPEIAAHSFNISRSCVNNCTLPGAEEELDLSHGIPFLLEVTCIIPYALGIIASYFLALKSDESGARTNHAVASLGLSIFGFAFLAIFSAQDQAVRYFFGAIPAVIGLLSSVPSIFAYAMEHASGDTQRGTVAAIAAGLGHSLGLLISAIIQLSHSSPTVINNSVDWITVFTLCTSVACIIGAQKLNEVEESNNWGKAPGLRRLLNDADEAKAWDIELNDVGDYLKSENISSPSNGYGTAGRWSSDEDL